MSLHLYQRRQPRASEPIFTRWSNDNWLWSAGQVSELLRLSKRAARRLLARLVKEGQVVRYR